MPLRKGLKIRLARHGVRGQPLYHIVVLDRNKPRDALPIEKLGEWDPVPQVFSTLDVHPSSLVFGKEHVSPLKERRLTWDVERIRYWLDQGAEPTDSVLHLFHKAGLKSDRLRRYQPGRKVAELAKRLVKTTSDKPLVGLGSAAAFAKGGKTSPSAS